MNNRRKFLKKVDGSLALAGWGTSLETKAIEKKVDKKNSLDKKI